MKPLKLKEFNDCKTHSHKPFYKAEILEAFAVIGTSKISLTELYMVCNNHEPPTTYFVQRFIKDKKNENMIIKRVKYKL